VPGAPSLDGAIPIHHGAAAVSSASIGKSLVFIVFPSPRGWR
jgi:hypothetical protein